VVYFLHEKSKAFKAFKDFKACVEKEVGTHIVCLRTNRGGEFTSKEFTDFCIHQGISRKLTELTLLNRMELQSARIALS